jgi:hypothetical protein
MRVPESDAVAPDEGSRDPGRATGSHEILVRDPAGKVVGKIVLEGFTDEQLADRDLMLMLLA